MRIALWLLRVPGLLVVVACLAHSANAAACPTDAMATGMRRTFSACTGPTSGANSGTVVPTFTVGSVINDLELIVTGTTQTTSIIMTDVTLTNSYIRLSNVGSSSSSGLYTGLRLLGSTKLTNVTIEYRDVYATVYPILSGTSTGCTFIFTNYNTYDNGGANNGVSNGDTFIFRPKASSTTNHHITKSGGSAAFWVNTQYIFEGFAFSSTIQALVANLVNCTIILDQCSGTPSFSATSFGGRFIVRSSSLTTFNLPSSFTFAAATAASPNEAIIKDTTVNGVLTIVANFAAYSSLTITNCVLGSSSATGYAINALSAASFGAMSRIEITDTTFRRGTRFEHSTASGVTQSAPSAVLFRNCSFQGADLPISFEGNRQQTFVEVRDCVITTTNSVCISLTAGSSSQTYWSVLNNTLNGCTTGIALQSQPLEILEIWGNRMDVGGISMAFPTSISTIASRGYIIVAQNTLTQGIINVTTTNTGNAHLRAVACNTVSSPSSYALAGAMRLLICDVYNTRLTRCNSLGIFASPAPRSAYAYNTTNVESCLSNGPSYGRHIPRSESVTVSLSPVATATRYGNPTATPLLTKTLVQKPTLTAKAPNTPTFVAARSRTISSVMVSRVPPRTASVLPTPSVRLIPTLSKPATRTPLETRSAYGPRTKSLPLTASVQRIATPSVGPTRSMGSTRTHPLKATISAGGSDTAALKVTDTQAPTSSNRVTGTPPPPPTPPITSTVSCSRALTHTAANTKASASQLLTTTFLPTHSNAPTHSPAITLSDRVSPTNHAEPSSTITPLVDTKQVYEPSPATKAATSATQGAAAVAAVVGASSGGQVSTIMTLMRLARCGEDVQLDPDLPVLVHPLRFSIPIGDEINQGDSRATASDQDTRRSLLANQRGAIIGNCILMPLLSAAIIFWPIAFCISRWAVVDMTEARYLAAWPSITITPFVVLVEGIAQCVVGLMADGGAINVVFGLFGAAVLVALVGLWGYVMATTPIRRLRLIVVPPVSLFGWWLSARREWQLRPLGHQRPSRGFGFLNFASKKAKRRKVTDKLGELALEDDDGSSADVSPPHTPPPLSDKAIEERMTLCASFLSEKWFIWADMASLVISIGVGTMEGVEPTSASVCLPRAVAATVLAIVQCVLGLSTLIPADMVLNVAQTVLSLLVSGIVIAMVVWKEDGGMADTLDALGVTISVLGIVGIMIGFVQVHSKSGAMQRRRARLMHHKWDNSLDQAMLPMAVPRVDITAESVSDGSDDGRSVALQTTELKPTIESDTDDHSSGRNNRGMDPPKPAGYKLGKNKVTSRGFELKISALIPDETWAVPVTSE